MENPYTPFNKPDKNSLKFIVIETEYNTNKNTTDKQTYKQINRNWLDKTSNNKKMKSKFSMYRLQGSPQKQREKNLFKSFFYPQTINSMCKQNDTRERERNFTETITSNQYKQVI